VAKVSDEKDEAQAKLAALDFKLGLYRHYKGGEYIVFAVSLNEETLEPLVHYYSLAKETRWTRTLDNFTSEVSNSGFLRRPRFEFVREASGIDFFRATSPFRWK
jgi:hypothetical protein